MKRAIGIAALLIGLSGCGVAYHSSDVRNVAGDDDLQIIDLTLATVAQANSDHYAPRALPAAFSVVAGGNQPRSAGRLPNPVLEPEIRPSVLETRLPPEADPGPYRIGTGDVLILATPAAGSTIEELAGLVAAQNQRQGYTVQGDGSISIPDVGRINVGGLTLGGAEDAIFERLIEARIDPSFSLEVAEFNSQRVSIGGAVNTPGLVPVTMAPLYLDEVLAATGGLSISEDDFGLIRIYRAGTLYQIPVERLFSDDGLLRIRMLDGDSIFVDTAYDLDRAMAYYEEQISRANYTRQARADAVAELQAEVSIRRDALDESRQNFRDRLEFGAADRDYVYVVGEVGEPGRFPLPFENRASLADALFERGGVAELSGDPSEIYLLRASGSGTSLGDIIAYRLDTTNAANFVLATRMELRPSDVVFVAEQPITRWNRVISQILPSISLADQVSAN